jgi:uncharacterized protein (TIGR03083 family)
MKTSEVITALRDARAELDALLEGMPAERLERPGVAGDWSVGDVLAHLLWYEREELALIRESDEPASPLWDVPQDRRNGLVREQLRALPAADVLAELRRVRTELIDAVSRLSDADLVTSGRFPGTSGERLPWQDIAHNSWAHERDHVAAIRAWLGIQEGA